MIWIVLALLGCFGIAAGKSIQDFQAVKARRASSAPSPVSGGPSTLSSPTSASPSQGGDEERLIPPNSQSTPLATCSSEMTFCTQEYMPKHCTVSINGTTFEADGSNGCQALQALLARVCAAGAREIPARDVRSLRCTDVSNAGRNDGN